MQKIISCKNERLKEEHKKNIKWWYAAAVAPADAEYAIITKMHLCLWLFLMLFSFCLLMAEKS